jgi:hypothetical protein
MVNPGVFRGSRKEFLIGEKDTYKAGVQGGYAADALANIQRRYFKRYPVDLSHDEEPSVEHLESLNDDTPDDEPEHPSEANLSPQEYAEALEAVEERRALINQRKAVKSFIIACLVWLLIGLTANQALDGVPTHERQ